MPKATAPVEPRGKLFDTFKEAFIAHQDLADKKLSLFKVEGPDKSYWVLAETYHKAKLTFAEQGPYTMKRLTIPEMLEYVSEALSGAGSGAADLRAGSGDGGPKGTAAA